MKTIFGTLLLSAALVVPASAATVQLTGVSGVWTDPNPSNTTNLSGVGTSKISWGNPASFFGGKSSYSFSATSTPKTLGSDVEFNLGTFSHDNNPITANPSFQGATLSITYDFLIDASSYSLTRDYTFSHYETVNQDNPCPNGGGNGSGVNGGGCADRVQITANPAGVETVAIGGVDYSFDITGFSGLALEDGIPTFWTREGRLNSANIKGVFTEYVEPAAIPLPASGLLLMGVMGGIAALRRRKAA